MVESSFTHTFISKPSMLKISHLSSRLPRLKEAEEGGPGTRLTYRAFKNAEAAECNSAPGARLGFLICPHSPGSMELAHDLTEL